MYSRTGTPGNPAAGPSSARERPASRHFKHDSQYYDSDEAEQGWYGERWSGASRAGEAMSGLWDRSNAWGRYDEEEDNDFLNGNTKGKGRAASHDQMVPEETLTDEEYAVYVHNEESHRYGAVSADRRLALSIAEAVETDSELITGHLAEEEAAARDRQAAFRLAGYMPPPHNATSAEPKQIDDDTFSALSVLNLGASTAESEGGKSVRSVRSREDIAESKRVCIACQERIPFYETALVPCSHAYCSECLQSLFEAATVDETLYPPRCCRKTIPVTTIRHFLTQEIKRTFSEKKVEFETKDRTYCSAPRCSTFINPEDISQNSAVCPKCFQVTCSLCKRESHFGEGCGEDEAAKHVLEMAEENGWKRCVECRRMVELAMGCNHITCVCKAEWCYVCGKDWKTCECPQWDEAHLIGRAEGIVDQDPVPLRGLARQHRVRRVRRQLRQRHECNHPDYTFRRGPYTCDNCRANMKVFTLQCDQCLIRVCRRCRDNRL